MGVNGVKGGRQVQEGEHQESQKELIREARYHLSNFGISCVLESTSNDDLKYVWGKKSDMPSELYPILVRLAEEEAAELQRLVIYDFEEDLKEATTEKEREMIISEIKIRKEMTPREYWEESNRQINEYHRSTGLDLFGNPKKEN